VAMIVLYTIHMLDGAELEAECIPVLACDCTETVFPSAI